MTEAMDQLVNMVVSTEIVDGLMAGSQLYVLISKPTITGSCIFASAPRYVLNMITLGAIALGAMGLVTAAGQTVDVVGAAIVGVVATKKGIGKYVVLSRERWCSDDDTIIAIEATILRSLEQRVIVGGIVKDAMLLLFKAVTQESSGLQCKNHRPQPVPNYSYSDGTATTSLTCFSPEVHTFVRDCNEVVNEAHDKDPYHLPPALKELEGTIHVFQFHFGKGAKLGQPDFKLNGVNKPKTLALKPSTTDSTATSSTSQDTEDAIEITTGKNKVTVTM
ncbi:hypothetical protein Tco_0632864 [Tanacetum coccineum]